ncbi:hypothetical protein HGB47_14915 [Leptospira yasudae]|uniref:hypothetical protein n=1 Tax=Leptospira yasudae TaxID=2202201 RepID=UPI001C4FE4EA|nr:hypothetical protein [Leptospira yasudae]MBW0434908.1 hypothetical protein [Leptospira yasudae]
MEENTTSLLDKIRIVFIQILEWGLSIFGFLMAFAGFLSDANIFGIFLIFLGAFCLFPPTNRFFLSKITNLISRKLRLGTFVALFILGLIIVSANKKNEVASKQNITATSEQSSINNLKLNETQIEDDKSLSGKEIIETAKRFRKAGEYSDCVGLIKKYQKNHKLTNEINNLAKDCEKLDKEKSKQKKDEEAPIGIILFFLLTPVLAILIFGSSSKCPSCKKWFSRKLDKLEFLYSTWKHTRKDGGPDLRYKSNPETKVYKRYFHCKRCEYEWDDIIRK